MNRAFQLRQILKTKGLIISRIPQRTKKQFTDIAKAEFCDDYGMTLKWLMDYAFVIQPLLDRVTQIEKRLDSKQEEPKKEKKMIGGNELK